MEAHSIEACLICRDQLASIAFQTGVLGFTVHRPPDPDPTSFDSKHAGPQRDGHRPRPHLAAHAGDGVFGSKIDARVSTRAGSYERAVARGLSTAPRLTHHRRCALASVPQMWGMSAFWVHDPDRNVITFGEPICVRRVWGAIPGEIKCPATPVSKRRASKARGTRIRCCIRLTSHTNGEDAAPAKWTGGFDPGSKRDLPSWPPRKVNHDCSLRVF